MAEKIKIFHPKLLDCAENLKMNTYPAERQVRRRLRNREIRPAAQSRCYLD